MRPRHALLLRVIGAAAFIGVVASVFAGDRTLPAAYRVRIPAPGDDTLAGSY